MRRIIKGLTETGLDMQWAPMPNRWLERLSANIERVKLPIAQKCKLVDTKYAEWVGKDKGRKKKRQIKWGRSEVDLDDRAVKANISRTQWRHPYLKIDAHPLQLLFQLILEKSAVNHRGFSA